MPRARISRQGIEIAKPGFDVDTAGPGDMIFSSQFVTFRLAMTGVVTVAHYSGYLDSRYERAVVTFPQPFPNPPIVLAAGILPDGRSDQSQHYRTIVPLDSSKPSYALPHYSIETFTDRFELYVLTRDLSGYISFFTRTWRYFVFSNTIDE